MCLQAIGKDLHLPEGRSRSRNLKLRGFEDPVKKFVQLVGSVALILTLAIVGPYFVNASLAGEVAPGGSQSAPKADDAGKQAGNQQPAPDPFVARVGAVRDFISGTIGSWAIVILVALLVFYRPIKDLLAALANSIRDRGVTLDISTFVKLQLSEPPLDLPDDHVTVRSPQELELEPPEDRSSVLSDIAPQLEFQISDRMARYYAENGHEREKVLVS